MKFYERENEPNTLNENWEQSASRSMMTIIIEMFGGVGNSLYLALHQRGRANRAPSFHRHHPRVLRLGRRTNRQ